MARKKKIETAVVQNDVVQTESVVEKTTEAIEADTRICVEVADKYKNISSLIIDNRLVPIEDGKIYCFVTTQLSHRIRRNIGSLS